MQNKPFVVLMAEDNEDDVEATRRAWKKYNIVNPLYVVEDGRKCIDYLFQRGQFQSPESAPRPGVLLLDLQMPRMDGLTVLKKIRQSGEFQHLPVVILTTSQNDEDRLASYDLGVNAFIRKPVGFSNFSKAIQTINLFWELVELPEVTLGNQ